MSVRAVSTPNIAIIKYWGNRNEEWRLPAADSLSITLDNPSVEVAVDHSEKFSARSFEPDGSEQVLTEKEIERLEKHFLLTKKYLDDIGEAKAFPSAVSIEVRSRIPRSIGLASSSAVFSALAEAYAGFDKLTAGGFEKRVPRHNISILARLGKLFFRIRLR